LAKVIPFEGFHYNAGRFGQDVKRLVSPPYDVIDGCLERKLKEDRLNITHVILGNENDSYTVAARRLKTWIEDGVIIRDAGRSFYLYEQTFSMEDGTARVRSGIVGLVKLEEFSKGVVLPHEKTIPRHKADRMELMCSVGGDTEQVFLLYDEPSNQIEAILAEARKKEEELRFFDSDGVQHRIVRIDDPQLVDRISELFLSVNLLIADGHHRYETSLEYRDMRSAKEKTGGERTYGYIMASLVSFRDRGLVIYPTHRLIQGVDPKMLDRLPEELEREFETENFANEDRLAEAVEKSTRRSFGLWIPCSGTVLLASPKEAGPTANPMENLPVWIVQEKVLKKILGYTSEMLDTKVNIEYVKGTGPTKNLMDTGEYQACFFVKPPSVEQVMKIAQSGEKMPHKSTYFFPKIWSGTLLYLFDY
jgi:uncharacterized protein (DUF1015 family)